MGVLQRFERRLEGLVQGAFARAFGGWVEPVEVAAALTREAQDKKAIVAAGRVLVPNQYVVELGASDSDRLREYDEPLRKELADMLAETAQEQGWSFVGPIEVRFEEVDGLDTGAFRVRSAVLPGAVSATPEPKRSPGEGPHLVAGPRTVELAGTTVVGRGVEADLQVADTGVSRRHAEFRVVREDGAKTDRVELHDLGSTNGTRVNGQRVRAVTLTDGDHITFGGSEFVYRAGR